MVEQKKLIKEDIYEKKKIGRADAPLKQTSTTLPNPPISKTQQFNEPGRVSDITKQENILLKKKPVVEEIHEKPVVEVHEKPIYKNVKEPMQTNYVKDSTIVEEFGNKKAGEKIVKEKLAEAPNTKMVYMKPKVSEVSEAPVVHKDYQIKKEIHNQPVIHEIHEKPIQEIHEQNIVRVVHENPEITKVKEAPVYLSEDKRLSENLKYGSGQQGLSSGQQTLGGQQGFTGGQQGLSSGQQTLGGQQGFSSGQQGFTGGQQSFDTSGGGYTGKSKVLESDFNKGYGGKGGWKKEEVVKDSSGNIYKKEHKHKENLESLPKKTYIKEDKTYTGSSLNRNRESPLSSPSSPSSPPSPTYNRGEKKHGLAQKIKDKLHIGDSHHKKTY